ncbi:MAG: TolC family protein [Planctomycetota bacterium]|nr:MAG: TolC family protein [Planctomycetota bacterium]
MEIVPGTEAVPLSGDEPGVEKGPAEERGPVGGILPSPDGASDSVGAGPLPSPDGQSGTSATIVSIDDVVESIYAAFPLVQATYQQAEIAEGNLISARGAFDTKLKAASENYALGFYENFRHSAGMVRPIYSGGEFFSGYRIGRGDFQPWYLERQTNEGGEFKAGLTVPLARNRDIDARRAALQRARFQRLQANPAIQSDLILFVRDGTVAYWNWIAAGQKYEIGQRALRLAQQRNRQLERRVELGDVAPPVLQDNLRSIAQREAKVIDLERKLRQAALKLSLYIRTPDGQPLVLGREHLAGFPSPFDPAQVDVMEDVAVAMRQRPELAFLDYVREQISVDLAEATNDTLPTLDAQVVGSQDVGTPTSSKRDKSPFELEANFYFEVPWERRKALGKQRMARAKLVQVSAKRRFTEDKIVMEVQSAFTALSAAFRQIDRASESRRLAEYMADVERRKFELGQSDLFAVVLREQYAIEAAVAEVEALEQFFIAKADYDAALARDWPALQ